ncbi:MAG: NAD(P)-binding domain-containing protein [Solirubrobacteraceae bacterium]
MPTSEEREMKIGIIGAGNIGGALAHRFTQLGHEVSIANSRGPDTLREVEAETGATAVTAREATQGKDVVVVTIPEKTVAELPDDLFAGVGDDVVVIDTGNYYPRQRDGRIDEIEAGTPESMWVSQQIKRPVVKAFNNIYAQHLRDHGRPHGSDDRIGLPVAGDQPAKATVMQLVKDLGFDAVDAGSLEESWRQQPGTPVYAADLDADAVRRALGEASRDRPADFRATPNSPGSYTDPA